MQNRRGIDELRGLFEPTGVEIGHGQRIPRVEPEERSRGIVLQLQR